MSKFLDEQGLAYLLGKLNESGSSSAYPGIRAVRLKVSEWKADKTQDEIVIGIKPSQESQSVILQPVYNQDDAFDQYGISIQSRGINTITFHADTVPTQDLLVYLTIFDLDPEQQDTYLDHIAITHMPDKTRYVKDTPFDPTGLTVTAYFSNGLSFIVGNESLTFTPNTSIPFGTQNIVASFNWGGVEKSANIPVEVIKAYVYGVKTTEPKYIKRSRLERTDDAIGLPDPIPYKPGMNEVYPSSPFDDIYPWSEMVVEDRPHGKFVKIPKFYYKLEQEGTYGFSLKICKEKLDGYWCSPLHMARPVGSHSIIKKPLKEIPYAYVSASFWDGGITNASWGNKRLGVTQYLLPSGVYYYYEFINAIQSDEAVADNIFGFDLSAMWTIIMLFMVEYAEISVQEAIGDYGMGHAATANAYLKNVAMDIPYHTGYAEKSFSSTNYYPVMYRYIQNLWGMWNYVMGCKVNLSSSGRATESNPGTFSYTIDPSATLYTTMSEELMKSVKKLVEAYHTASSEYDMNGYIIQGWYVAIPTETEKGIFPYMIPCSIGNDEIYSVTQTSYTKVGNARQSVNSNNAQCMVIMGAYWEVSYYKGVRMYLNPLTSTYYGMQALTTSSTTQAQATYPRLIELPQPDDEQEVNQNGSN